MIEGHLAMLAHPIEQRADEEVGYRTKRRRRFRAITIEENSIDYSEYEKKIKIKTLKGE